jgi:hypothetical protein
MRFGSRHLRDSRLEDSSAVILEMAATVVVRISPNPFGPLKLLSRVFARIGQKVLGIEAAELSPRLSVRGALRGSLEVFDLAHPAGQWVPSGTNLGHHLQVVDSKRLKSPTHFTDRTAGCKRLHSAAVSLNQTGRKTKSEERCVVRLEALRATAAMLRATAH